MSVSCKIKEIKEEKVSKNTASMKPYKITLECKANFKDKEDARHKIKNSHLTIE